MSGLHTTHTKKFCHKISGPLLHSCLLPLTAVAPCWDDYMTLAVYRHILSRVLARPVCTACCMLQVGSFVSPAMTGGQYAVRIGVKRGAGRRIPASPDSFCSKCYASCQLQSTFCRQSRVDGFNRRRPCLIFCTTRPRFGRR